MAQQQTVGTSSRLRHNLDSAIFRQLQTVLRDHNSYLRSFLTVQELLDNGHVTEDIKIVLYADKRPPEDHARTYNLPTSNEVAILLPTNLADEVSSRVVVCDYRANQTIPGLQRFTDTHRSYDPLSYPLLFPFGTDGFHLGIPHSTCTGSKCVTAREFYSFRLMLRPNCFKLLHRSCRLFQQYCVDMWAKIETGRLYFIRHNQVTFSFLKQA